MDYKKILMGLLSTAYTIDDGKLQTLFNDEESNDESTLQKLMELDAERVKSIKSNRANTEEEKFQQGYAKAKKEVLTDFETQLKEVFNASNSEKKGLDLISDIIANNAKSNISSDSLTEDDIKKHPVYQRMELGLKTQLAETAKTLENQINDIKGEYQRKEVMNKIKSNANQLLDSLNPVLANNSNVANNIKNKFLSEFDNYNFDIQDGGHVVIMDKNGKIVEDAHGNSQKFENMVKGIAENYFEFRQNNGGTNAGNNNEPTDLPKIPVFKNENEMLAYTSDKSIPLEDRMTAKQQFDESNGSGE